MVSVLSRCIRLMCSCYSCFTFVEKIHKFLFLCRKNVKNISLQLECVYVKFTVACYSVKSIDTELWTARA